MGRRLLYCFNMCANKRHSITVGIVYKQGKYHGAQINPRVQVIKGNMSLLHCGTVESQHL